jgi:hypothetical protein
VWRRSGQLLRKSAADAAFSRASETAASSTARFLWVLYRLPSTTVLAQRLQDQWSNETGPGPAIPSDANEVPGLLEAEQGRERIDIVPLSLLRRFAAFCRDLVSLAAISIILLGAVAGHRLLRW